MKRSRSKVDLANAKSYKDFRKSYVPEDLLVYSTPAGHDGSNDTYSIALKDTIPANTKTSPAAGSEALGAAREAELEACFDLICRTSSSDYETSTIGWRPAAKRAEMREEGMRFLLVRKQDSKPDENRPSHEDLGDKSEREVKNAHPRQEDAAPQEVSITKDKSILGFASFMITVEEGQDVVYIYEIHLEEEQRGCGLGRHLFKIMEHVGTATGMEKAMLTVFRKNKQARAMYERLRYEVDDCSPRVRRLRGGVVKEPDYMILSKVLQEPTLSDEAHGGATDPKRRKLAS